MQWKKTWSFEADPRIGVAVENYHISGARAKVRPDISRVKEL